MRTGLLKAGTLRAALLLSGDDAQKRAADSLV